MNSEKATATLKTVQDRYSVDFYQRIILAHIVRRAMANKNNVELHRIFGDDEGYRIAPEPSPMVMQELEDRFTILGYEIKGSLYKEICWGWPSEIVIASVGSRDPNKEQGKTLPAPKSFNLKRWQTLRSIFNDVVGTTFLVSALGLFLYFGFRAVQFIEQQNTDAAQQQELPQLEPEQELPKPAKRKTMEGEND